MADNAEPPFASLLDSIPDDVEQLSVVDEIRLIGRFVWELAGRSVGRLILIFATVFVAAFLPAALITLGLTVAGQTYTRIGLIVAAAICLIPLAALASFNFTAYRGLRDIADKLAFGQKIGAGLVAFIDSSDRIRIPLNDFTGRLKSYLIDTRKQIPKPEGKVKRIASRMLNGIIFYSARFMLNRIAKDCVVDHEVDLEKFAIGIGERADDILISYFKTLLWDLTRLILSFAILVIWLVIVIVTQLVKLIP